MGSGLVMAPYPNRLGLRQGCDAWRDCPGGVPHLCFAVVQLYAGLVLQVVGQAVEKLSDTVWRGRDINVIEECCCSFSWKQVALGGAEGKVQPQREKGRHQGIPLFAPIGLCDATHLAGVVRPQIRGRLAVELADERWRCLRVGCVKEPLQHGSTADIVICPDPVYRKNGLVGI